MTILVAGDANADLTATLTRFPSEGDDSPVTALGWGSGGSATNVAAGLALLGTPARLLARVGNDPAAEIALRVARTAGVDLRYVQCDATLATGLCYAAISPGGERTFLSYRGANMAMAPGNWESLFNQVGLVHIAGHTLLEGTQRETGLALIEAATARDIPISLDLCLPLVRAHRASLLELLPRLALVFGNQRELALLATGTLAGHDFAIEQLDFSILAAQTLVIKLGRDGCLLLGSQPPQTVPGFTVDAIDTNGSGDAFVAGFLDALLRGEALNACARRGNACGALAATRSGAAEALPSRVEVDALLTTKGTNKHEGARS